MDFGSDASRLWNYNFYVIFKKCVTVLKFETILRLLELLKYR
jgi:hypothetical protein